MCTVAFDNILQCLESQKLYKSIDGNNLFINGLNDSYQ